MEKSTLKPDSQTVNDLSGDLYFLQSTTQIESRFSTSATAGLVLDSIPSLQTQYGLNELNQNTGVSIWSILTAQLFNAMVLVLVLAFFVSIGIRSWIESGVIGAVIVINISVGFYSELGAARNMASLKSLASPNAHVIRSGTAIIIPTAQVCVGDLVELKTGDVVPADLRLTESMNFETDEALLTGESLPVAKSHTAVYSSINAAEIAIGDRLNMAYSSSIVTKGRAKGLVIAIGSNTEIGLIAEALRSSRNNERQLKKNKDGTAPVHRRIIFFGLVISDSVASFLGLNIGTPLQRKLSQLAILLLMIALLFALICFAANSFRTDQEIILYAVATGLSIIPASLVVVLTLTFAGGVKEMSDRRVIVRKLDSLEALGGTTHICSDKTGTLTQGKMVATSVWIPGAGTISITNIEHPFNPLLGSLSFDTDSPFQQITKINRGNIPLDSPASVTPADVIDQYLSLESITDVASLCNLATIVNRESGEWSARGDPTECALQVLACRFPHKGRALLAETDSPIWSQVAEFPFDSELKRMTVIFEKSSDQTQCAFMKGAIERVLPACNSLRYGDSLVTIDEAIRIEVLANVEALASQGLRVIALAQRNWIPETGIIDRDRVENEMTLVGLVGIYDPPRLETKAAVRAAHEAGVGVIMLTGDHPTTARAIALEVGIIPRNISQLSGSDIDGMVLKGDEFDRMSDDQIDALPRLPLVIARCAPLTKVRMVEALHRRSCFVAMTGDGVNDSPALSRADVGIGMGSGSDVAKDSSDIVLTDDNFASILVAIEEGRKISENCKRFLLHLLAENISQAFILLIGLGFKDDAGLSVFPLAPVEILWIIMITSSFPAMGLGQCRAPESLMKRKPHNVKIGVFTREVLVDTVVYGLIGAVLCLATFTLIVYGFGTGDLGLDSNNTLEGSDLVFRARSATFACLTWTSLILALEMMDLRRSLFRMKSKPENPYTQWMKDVYSNRFLFWSCIGGFLSCFPVIYIPVINIVVFKHSPISWEWSLVVISAILFTVLVEIWKFAKRVYYRRNEDTGTREELEIFREWTKPLEKIV